MRSPLWHMDPPWGLSASGNQKVNSPLCIPSGGLRHSQWHHMWTPAVVTTFRWLQDLCPGGYKAMVPAAVCLSSACKVWESPGDRWLPSSPSYKFSLLGENIDVPNMWLWRSKILLVNPFGWYKCDPEVNFMANLIQQLADQVRKRAALLGGSFMFFCC